MNGCDFEVGKMRVEGSSTWLRDEKRNRYPETSKPVCTGGCYQARKVRVN